MKCRSGSRVENLRIYKFLNVTSYYNCWPDRNTRFWPRSKPPDDWGRMFYSAARAAKSWYHWYRRYRESDLRGRSVYFLHIPIHFWGEICHLFLLWYGEAKCILQPWVQSLESKFESEYFVIPFIYDNLDGASWRFNLGSLRGFQQSL